jgi:2-polyprenyl-6-methoxyphenol hydroxylase-like FAD-dependent oxidoreductase
MKTHQPSAASDTDCCIVGAGPAGAILALLLARQGHSVTLLEAHADFERDFRGDTIHPSVLEIMDEIGLAERLLKLPHAKNYGLTAHTPQGNVQMIDFRVLKTRYPYVMLIPQARFLEFIVAEAARYPNFRLIMNARVESLIEADGAIRGVRYRDGDSMAAIHATLTVGADGRFSKVRKLSALESIVTSPPMDVLWFRLPREATDSDEASQVFIGNGFFVILLNRESFWQVGYLIMKHSYAELKAAGIEAFQASLAAALPEYTARLAMLDDWKAMSLLSIEANRLKQWYRPGLLMIGDAAHAMSPLGGVGINYAIQDAVVAANILDRPLRQSGVLVKHLRSVQRRREWPIRIIQGLQGGFHRRVIAQSLAPQNANPKGRGGMPPIIRAMFRLPLIRTIPTRLMAYGVWPVHVARRFWSAGSSRSQ